MKQSYFANFTNFIDFTDEIKLKLGELFPGSDAVRKYTFKTMRSGDNCALLAVICPIRTALVGLSRGKSALFQAGDCFECLSPHEIAA